MENNELNQQVETPELTPAEMFLRDLEMGDVSSESVVEPTVEESQEAPAVEEIVVEEPQPTMATMEDVENAKEDILQRIIAIANDGRANEEPKEVTTEKLDKALDPVEEATGQDIDEEALLESFYANPLEAIKSLANSIASKQIQSEVSGLKESLAPLIAASDKARQNETVRGVIGDFINSNPDAANYLEDIASYVKGNNLPFDNMQSFKDAYADSKIRRQGAELESLRANQGKSLDDYLGDQESLNKILNNENVKKQIITNYLNELNNGGKPATISGGGSATPVAQAPSKFSTFDDARLAFLNDLSK